MKPKFFNHIECLLFSHDCVIIPDFGAFIVNHEAAQYEGRELLPPKVAITFNQQVNHNDGLLATFCQQKDSISYESAHKAIKAFVSDIHTQLKQGNRVFCGKIGVLYLNENQLISFEPSRNYIHPDYIGLNKTGLFSLASLQEDYSSEKKKSRLIYVAAAAAVALFFVSPSVNIGEQPEGNRNQQADFSSLLTTTFVSKGSVSHISSEETEKFETKDASTRILMPQAQGTSLRTYYIVVASETSKKRTDILTNKIKKDFPDIALLESSGRYRLYAASFDDKQMAEDYLESFRKEHPKYKNSWLLSQRNK